MDMKMERTADNVSEVTSDNQLAKGSLCPACGHIYPGDTHPNFCGHCGSSHFLPTDFQHSIVSAVQTKNTHEAASSEFSAQSAPVWHTWRTKGRQSKEIGHDLTVDAMSAVRNYVTNHLAELTTLRKQWSETKKRSQDLYESQMQTIVSTKQEKQKTNEDRYQANIEKSRKEEIEVQAILADCSTFADAIPKKLKVARKRAGNQLSSLKVQTDKIIQLKKTENELYRSLYEISSAEAVRETNDMSVQAQQERTARDTAADRDYQEKKELVNQKYRADIAAGMNQQDAKSYHQQVRSTRFNASQYRCPSVIPEYVMLGTLNLYISEEGLDSIDVIQSLETQLRDHAEKKQNGIVLGMPYCQKLSDGISLLIRHTPGDRSQVMSQMQPLLLKLFMTIPAGRLEATLIDPLEIGKSFADLTKIAELPSGSRIIDTKIWSKEHEINNAIETLLQKMENLTQSYGNDKESRLKKEVVRVLAITDFPAEFSEKSLRHLRAIVRNSASLGVFVIILANESELEKLKVRHGALVDEITQGLLETRANGNRLMLQKRACRDLYLTLDDMQDALANKHKIITTIRDVIDHMQLKIEHFDQMFDADIEDSNNWFQGNHSEISVPVGIRGASTVVRMVLSRGGGNIEHHVLIAGQTGAGKSTLLHTMIMSTMLQYSPDEVQLYLVDFKEGIEFKVYTRFRLPSLRVVAIDSEREFGLNILKELCMELERRASLFSSMRHGVVDINDYMNLPEVEKKVPRLLLIFDEVQELFRSDMVDDDISSECLSCLSKLVMQGRAMGIHIILACQDFSHCTGLDRLFSQMAVRIAVKSSPSSAASILRNDNEGINALQHLPAGSAIYNGGGGAASANLFFQVSYMDQQKRMDLLTRLSEYFSDPLVAEQYRDLDTRVLLTNAEDDHYNNFNRLIKEGSYAMLRPFAESKGAFGLQPGFRFSRSPRFVIEMGVVERDNLLIVGKDEKLALSLFIFTALSALYEELHTSCDKNNVLIYLVDLSAVEQSDYFCDLQYLYSQFPDQIEMSGINDFEKMIAVLYQKMADRADRLAPEDERIFLLFFGIGRARCLRTESLYDEDGSGRPGTRDMLWSILERGPRHRINTVVWTESLRSVINAFGDRYAVLFDKRIAYGLKEADMDLLVSESDTEHLRSSTAVYQDINRDTINTHFRPYNLPTRDWVEQYALACEAAVSEAKGAL